MFPITLYIYFVMFVLEGDGFDVVPPTILANVIPEFVHGTYLKGLVPIVNPVWLNEHTFVATSDAFK